MFKAMVTKEFLLVLRDKHALLVLFIMPAIFILIMSVALRDQFATDKVDFRIFVKDLDHSEISKKLLDNLQQDKSFIVLATENDAEFIVTIPVDVKNDDARLSIIVAGGVNNELLEIFKAKLLKNVVGLKLKILGEELESLSDQASAAVNSVSLSYDKLFDISYKKTQEIPNSTQQTVPTWIVFGMFFVIIPMSTIYINEIKQNTLTRLSSMNISLLSMSLAKTVPYFVINHIQVWIMLAVGMYLVPFLDTPALEIKGSVLGLIILSLALSFSAIGLSSLIAVSAKSSEQATTIGGVLNILLGVIGGVMVPKFIMPESMQKFADISPMSWGLDGFLEIFLHASDVTGVLDESGMLALFGTVCITISMIILKFRISKGL
jgi:ABC-2 type transport system permease protein